jgi:uridine kinase
MVQVKDPLTEAKMTRRMKMTMKERRETREHLIEEYSPALANR